MYELSAENMAKKMLHAGNPVGAGGEGRGVAGPGLLAERPRDRAPEPVRAGEREDPGVFAVEAVGRGGYLELGLADGLEEKLVAAAAAVAR